MDGYATLSPVGVPRATVVTAAAVARTPTPCSRRASSRLRGLSAGGGVITAVDGGVVVTGSPRDAPHLLDAGPGSEVSMRSPFYGRPRQQQLSAIDTPSPGKVGVYAVFQDPPCVDSCPRDSEN